MTPLEALQAVIDKAGSQDNLRLALNLKSQGAISNMVKRGHAALGQVLKMEELFGVPRHKLRPDYYPKEARR